MFGFCANAFSGGIGLATLPFLACTAGVFKELLDDDAG